MNNSTSSMQTSEKIPDWMPRYTRRDLHLLRRSWHVIGSIIEFYLYSKVLTFAGAVVVIGTVFSFFFILEIGRKQSENINALAIKLMGPFLRSEEHQKLTGTFLFITGSMLSCLLYSRTACLLGILYLGFGDPIAAIVGGQIELPRLRLKNGKSIHGTLAAILVCSYITYLVLGQEGNQKLITCEQLWVLTVVGGLIGGLSEQISLRDVFPLLDDNVIIPVVSGFVLTCLFNMFQIDTERLVLLPPNPASSSSGWLLQ